MTTDDVFNDPIFDLSSLPKAKRKPKTNSTILRWRDALERIASGSADPIGTAQAALASQRGSHRANLIGRKFGLLEVIFYAGIHFVYKENRRRSTWLCMCECGTLVHMPASRLLNEGGPKSCGCTTPKREHLRLRKMRGQFMSYKDFEEMKRDGYNIINGTAHASVQGVRALASRRKVEVVGDHAAGNDAATGLAGHQRVAPAYPATMQGSARSSSVAD